MVHKYVLGTMLALGAVAATADTLLIENVRQSREMSQQLPARGASMATVESRFGTPADRSGPVGDPPIARWDYAGFVVYFEHDRVIHAVVRR